MKKKMLALLVITSLLLSQFSLVGAFAEEPAPQPEATSEAASIQKSAPTETPAETKPAEEPAQDVDLPGALQDDAAAEGPQAASPDPAALLSKGAKAAPQVQLLGTEPTRDGNGTGSVGLKVQSRGHGSVKVDGVNRGAEYQSTWDEGTEVSVEAVPDSGYKFNKWWIKSSPSNRSVTTPTTTLTAGTDTEAEASFARETASVTITAPAAGATAATTPQVSMPSDAGYTLDTNTELHGPNVRWVKAGSLYPYTETLDSSTVFEAGQTYYAYVRLSEGTDSFAATAGGSSFNTNLQVTGGTKSAQSNFAATISSGGAYIGIEAIIAVTIPEATPSYNVTFAFGTEEGVTLSDALESLTVNGESLEVPAGAASVVKQIAAGTEVSATVKASNQHMVFALRCLRVSEATTTYAEDARSGTISFTMPGEEVEVKAMFDKAVTFTYDANGGTKGPGWRDSMVYPASLMNMIDGWHVDNAPVDPISNQVIVEPPANHKYAGIEITAKNSVKSGKPGTNITGLDFSEGAAFKYLWAKQVTVTFNAKGGTPEPVAQTFDAGDKAAEPTTEPTKTGWEPDPESWGGGFDGWYTDENYSNEFDFNTAVEDDITLYARWNGRLDVEVYDKTSGANLVGGTIACENVEESVTGLTQYGSSNIAEGTKVTLTATPDTGYRFVGWEKPAPDAPVTVSTDATYEFTFTDNPTTLYAVFEVKPLTITLVPTTIDGKRPVENYEFEMPPGKSFDDVDTTEKFTAALNHFRAAEGYIPYDDDIYLLPDELGNYSSWDEVEDADLYFEKLNADATFYVPMAKNVTEIPITVEAPICGTETTFERNGYKVNPDTAVNMPAVTIEGGVAQPYEGTAAERFWWVTEDAGTHQDIFNGRFVGGSKYGVFLQLEPAFGYGFDTGNPPIITFNGTVTDKTLYFTSSDIDVIGLVTADHDWDEWTVTKEPTVEAEGEETRACKHCDKKETRPIPKVVYNCTAGDGQTWTKGSGKDAAFTFERSYKPETTYQHYENGSKEILVDGTVIDPANYVAAEGSLLVTLKASYLETLDTGAHTLTASFDETTVDAKFTVVKQEEKKEESSDDPASDSDTSKKSKQTTDTTPTGDDASLTLWLLLLCSAVLLALHIRGRRRVN